MLRIFEEHFFYRIALNDCFWLNIKDKIFTGLTEEHKKEDTQGAFYVEFYGKNSLFLPYLLMDQLVLLKFLELNKTTSLPLYIGDCITWSLHGTFFIIFR